MEKSQFTIREAVYFDGYDHGSHLFETIRNSANRRKISFLSFILKKTRNIILARLAYFCPLNSWRIAMHRWRGVNIGKHVYIGQQCTIDNAYPEFIYIEDYVGIANESVIIAHITAFPHFKKIIPSRAETVLIKKGASFGMRTMVLAGVTIGECAIVSAGSVVIDDVEDYTVVRGNPAKEIGKVKQRRIIRNW